MLMMMLFVGQKISTATLIEKVKTGGKNWIMSGTVPEAGTERVPKLMEESVFNRLTTLRGITNTLLHNFCYLSAATSR